MWSRSELVRLKCESFQSSQNGLACNVNSLVGSVVAFIAHLKAQKVNFNEKSSNVELHYKSHVSFISLVWVLCWGNPRPGTLSQEVNVDDDKQKIENINFCLSYLSLNQLSLSIRRNRQNNPS